MRKVFGLAKQHPQAFSYARFPVPTEYRIDIQGHVDVEYPIVAGKLFGHVPGIRANDGIPVLLGYDDDILAVHIASIWRKFVLDNKSQFLKERYKKLTKQFRSDGGKKTGNN